MADIFVPIPNIGFKVAISEFGVNPTANDIIGDIRSITGVRVTVNTVDATPIDSQDGVTRPAPTTKTVAPMTITLFKKNSSYQRIADKILGKSVTDSQFYCSLTIFYPKEVGATESVPDYTYDGFISELSFSDGEAEQVQTFSFVFTPIAKPRVATPISDPAG